MGGCLTSLHHLTDHPTLDFVYNIFELQNRNLSVSTASVHMY